FQVTKSRNHTIAKLLRSGLADFLLQALACIADALVLIRIWRTQRAHIGSDLSDLLSIDSTDRQTSLFGIDGDFNTSRQGKLDGMGESQRKPHRAFPLHLDAVADSHDLEFLLPTVSHTFDAVKHQSSGQSMDSCLRIVLTRRQNMPVFLFNLNSARDRCIQLA